MPHRGERSPPAAPECWLACSSVRRAQGRTARIRYGPFKVPHHEISLDRASRRSRFPSTARSPTATRPIGLRKDASQFGGPAWGYRAGRCLSRSCNLAPARDARRRLPAGDRADAPRNARSGRCVVVRGTERGHHAHDRGRACSSACGLPPLAAGSSRRALRGGCITRSWSSSRCAPQCPMHSISEPLAFSRSSEVHSIE